MNLKKWLKVILIIALVYVGIVALFESSLGFMQPQADNTAVITTFDENDTPHQRVVSLLRSEGKQYIAANHWPRAWFRQVRANGKINMRYQGAETEHKGVVVAGAEHDQVQRDNPTGIVFRILTGFPPRYFVRLDTE